MNDVQIVMGMLVIFIIVILLCVTSASCSDDRKEAKEKENPCSGFVWNEPHEVVFESFKSYENGWFKGGEFHYMLPNDCCFEGWLPWFRIKALQNGVLYTLGIRNYEGKFIKKFDSLESATKAYQDKVEESKNKKNTKERLSEMRSRAEFEMKGGTKAPIE